MEGTRPSTVNSIGMFDMLKGVGMITIVLAHTAELYPNQVSASMVQRIAHGVFPVHLS